LNWTYYCIDIIMLLLGCCCWLPVPRRWPQYSQCSAIPHLRPGDPVTFRCDDYDSVTFTPFSDGSPPAFVDLTRWFGPSHTYIGCVPIVWPWNPVTCHYNSQLHSHYRWPCGLVPPLTPTPPHGDIYSCYWFGPLQRCCIRTWWWRLPLLGGPLPLPVAAQGPQTYHTDGSPTTTLVIGIPIPTRWTRCWLNVIWTPTWPVEQWTHPFWCPIAPFTPPQPHYLDFPVVVNLFPVIYSRYLGCYHLVANSPHLPRIPVPDTHIPGCYYVTTGDSHITPHICPIYQQFQAFPTHLLVTLYEPGPYALFNILRYLLYLDMFHCWLVFQVTLWADPGRLWR